VSILPCEKENVLSAKMLVQAGYWITLTENSTQIGHQQFGPEQIFTCQYDGVHHFIYSHKIIKTTSIPFMPYIPVKEDVDDVKPRV
jgi:hypothetical protein